MIIITVTIRRTTTLMMIIIIVTTTTRINYVNATGIIVVGGINATCDDD